GLHTSELRPDGGVVSCSAAGNQPRIVPGRGDARTACGLRSAEGRPDNRRSRTHSGVARPHTAHALRSRIAVGSWRKKRGRSNASNGPSLGRKRPGRATKGGWESSLTRVTYCVATNAFQPPWATCDNLTDCSIYRTRLVTY